ncbi:type II secretion system F family protein [Anaerococcus porci]|uniref:type II secretion system F family protein n=1 Tax=Anaerococcus porci TaxID=2652269 RepID=UPI002A75319C|nr:type II secretion system F family protein [Anaerococcus porci]MDY3006199.1 type II secretion system F family protein [Anaerococcus porci]
MNNINLKKLKEFFNKDIGNIKINSNILALFLKQLALLLDSSISLYDSLEIIISQGLDKKLNKSLTNIKTKLNEGYQAYDAFKFEEKAMGPLIIAFIKSGDESGNLSYILDELSKYLTEDSKNKSQIKQAFIYPVILLLVTFIVIIIMTTKVLPTFISVFENSHNELPLATRFLLSISEFMTKNGLNILLILIVLCLFLIYLMSKKEYRIKIDSILFKSFLFKKFRMLNVEYQITSLLYILKRGDISIIDCMDIIKDSFKNKYIKAKFENIKSSLRHGLSLSDAISKENIFSNLMISMVKIGEDSGNMSRSLEKASSYYANEYIFRLKRISALAEPVLILIMATIVAFVVFSVAIPMFDSVNNIDF